MADFLQPGAFPALMDPRSMGILAAAFQGLNASGPSRMPVSMGQVIGQAGMAGLGAYQGAAESQRKAAQTDALIDLEKQKAAMEKLRVDQAMRQASLQEPFMRALAERFGFGGGATTAQPPSVAPSPSPAPQMPPAVGMNEQDGLDFTKDVVRGGGTVNNLLIGPQQASAPQQGVQAFVRPPSKGILGMGPQELAMMKFAGLPDLIEHYKLTEPDIQTGPTGIITNKKTGEFLGTVPFGSPSGDILQLQNVGGQWRVAPVAGAVQTKQTLSAAGAAGPAQFETTNLPGPGGSTTPVLKSNLPQILGGQGGTPSGAPAGPNIMSRTQTTSEKAESEKFGTGLGEAAMTVITNGANSSVALRDLSQASELVKSFTPDKLSPLKQSLGEWAISMKLMTEDEARKTFGDVKDMKSLASKFDILAAKMVRQTDSQPAARQLDMIRNAMPNNASVALQDMIDLMRDSNIYNIEKLKAMEAYRATHNGSVDGFEKEWTTISANLPLFMAGKRGAMPLPKEPGNAEPRRRRFNPATGKFE